MKINEIKILNSYGDIKQLFTFNNDEEILNFIEENKNIEAETSFEINGIGYFIEEISVRLVEKKLEIIIWINQPPQ